MRIGNFSDPIFLTIIFLPEKSCLQKILQAIRHQCQTDCWLIRKNVLTAKKSLFLGVLAGKQGFRAEKKDDYFAFLHVFVFFLFCMLLPGGLLWILEGSKKNRAENPTVGFCFVGSCVTIAR